MGKDEEKKEDESLDDIVFKAKLDYLSKNRKNATEYKELAAALRKERPDSVPLLSEQLTFALEGPKPETESDEQAYKVKEVESILDALKKDNGGPIDVAALAQYFGTNEPDKDELEEDDNAKKLNKEMKEQRDLLRKVLLARANLTGELADKGTNADSLDKAVVDMKKWVTADS